MMVARAVVLACLLALVMQVKTDPDLGISEGLARERASRLSNVRYDLAFTIPAARTQPVAGRALIRFSLNGTSEPLVLDYQPDRSGFLRSVEANGRETTVRQVNGHIIVPAEVLRDGENSLALEFNAGDGPLNRNDDFLYTIFVPARAHQAFPCFDQPDLKARWSLALDVPGGWQALGNGAEIERQNAGGRTRVRFAGTQPVSTYLFSFAAGKFAIEQAERNGRTFRMFHRETDVAKVARNRDAVFDLHAGALAWLEDFTAIPYPFGKFDFLLVPAFQFGGMEHPGSIFYNANGLLLDESATQDQMLGRASVIAHETAHMWFGDLVTMDWFSDVWMKEVFANHLAAKIVNPAFPAINHDLRYLVEHFPSAYAVDRTEGTNEIRQPLANLNEAGSLYGAIIYQKAPIVMRQLETLVGAEGFRDGLREYLRMYSFGNASWPDLIAILDGRTSEDLAAWSRAWVEERGRPVITTELSLSNGTIRRLAFTQRDADTRRGLIWNQRIKVALGANDTTLVPVQLNGRRTDVPAARGLPARFVLPNGGGIAYGEFHLDHASLTWLMANLPSIEDELTRASAWVTLWDAVLTGDTKAARFLGLAIAALPVETNELNINRVLSYVREAYWRHTAPAARRALAGRLEPVLRAGLDAATTSEPEIRLVLGAARRGADEGHDRVAHARLEGGRKGRRPDARRDRLHPPRAGSRRSRRAGRRGHPGPAVRANKNPDRKAQFAFVRPALSGRRARAGGVVRVARRRRQPPPRAVGAGRSALPAPSPACARVGEVSRAEPAARARHPADGRHLLPEALDGRDAQRTPSASAAATVREYVDRLPAEYPERLRRIILSSADDLFRATRGK